MNRVARTLAIAFTIAAGAAGGAPERAEADLVDRSHAVFFPAEVREKLDIVQSFPLFWWNFLVLDAGEADIESGRVEAECLRWQARAREIEAATPGTRVLGKLACGTDLSNFRGTLRDWARDEVFRRPYPGNHALADRMSETLTQASLPIGRGLIDVLRDDPTGSYRDLRALLEERVPIELPRRTGYFVDAEKHRVIIPIQLAYPPSETRTTRFLLDASPYTPETMGSHRARVTRSEALPYTFVGPHSATYGNESEVMSDVAKVSVAGVVLTVLQLLALLALKRARALLLFPIVAVGTAVAALGTIAIFGSIHGLTLAFGTGLAGMAIDYGLHSVFNTGHRGVWRANFCGLVTTLAGFLILTRSEVPLLRQLMVFSILGIAVGYALYYVLHTRYPKTFAVDPLAYVPAGGKWRLALVAIAIGGAIAGVARLRPDFSLSQFDFLDPHSVEVRNTLYSHLSSRNALFLVERADAGLHDRAEAIQAWSRVNAVPVENLARYFPAAPIARANLKTWIAASCERGGRSKSAFAADSANEKFFAPFRERTSCERLRALASAPAFGTDAARGETSAGAGRGAPEYVRDFADGDEFVSIFLPKDAAGVSLVKSNYPDARSIREMVEVFPYALERELRWMSPLAILLASFFLYLYYRRLTLALVALVPFACALGVYSLAAFAFRLDVSFMTLIALLMIFGFSIDYGVFAVDVVTEPKGRSVRGVWSCLLFSGIATGLGFIPLLFCRHPVMAHLGQALVFGTLGTHLGTLWGVPGVLRLLGLADVSAYDSREGECAPS